MLPGAVAEVWLAAMFRGEKSTKQSDDAYVPVPARANLQLVVVAVGEPCCPCGAAEEGTATKVYA
jgi:hypothetical protein